MSNQEMPEWLFNLMTSEASKQKGVGKSNGDFKDGFIKCFELMNEKIQKLEDERLGNLATIDAKERWSKKYRAEIQELEMKLDNFKAKLVATKPSSKAGYFNT